MLIYCFLLSLSITQSFTICIDFFQNPTTNILVVTIDLHSIRIIDRIEHLKEEERTLPAIIQSYVTREQNHSCVQEILRLGGMDGLHTELPGVMVATKHWATPTYYEQFLQEVSPALAQLAQDVFIPNYMNIHCAFRDSPTRNLPPVVDEIPLDPSRLPRPAPEAPLSSK